MKPSSVLSADDVLINTGTGIREKQYQNRIRRYLQDTGAEFEDADDMVNDEGHSNIQKSKSKFDMVMAKCKLNRKDHLVTKFKNRSIFKTEDSNLTIHKILNKEAKIQKLIFGKDYKRKAKKIIDEEKIDEILVPPFYAWVHLSCWIFTPEVYYTNTMLVKLTKLPQDRFDKPWYICKKYNKKNVNINFGTTVTWSEPKWELNFHVECARRRGKEI